jgi:hypothetical protein
MQELRECSLHSLFGSEVIKNKFGNTRNKMGLVQSFLGVDRVCCTSYHLSRKSLRKELP